jgi:hypothetical protein
MISVGDAADNSHVRERVEGVKKKLASVGDAAGNSHVRERVEGVKKKLASVGDAAHWRVGSTSLIDSSICQLSLSNTRSGDGRWFL